MSESVIVSLCGWLSLGGHVVIRRWCRARPSRPRFLRTFLGAR